MMDFAVSMAEFKASCGRGHNQTHRWTALWFHSVCVQYVGEE